MYELTVPAAEKSFASHKRSQKLAAVDPHRDFASPVSGASWARSYRLRLVFTDTAIIVADIALAYGARLAIDPSLLSSTTALARFALGAVVIVALWSMSMVGFRSRDVRVIGVGPDEYKRVISGTVTFFGVLAIVFIVGAISSAQWFFIIAAPVGIFALLVSRWLWRKWLIRQRAEGRFLSRVVVVGKLTDALKVAGQIDRSLGAGYLVAAIIVDKQDSRIESNLIQGVNILRGTHRAVEYASNLECDGIVIAGGPRGKDDFVRDLAWALEGKSLELILAPSLANIAGPRIHHRPIDGLPLLQVEIPEFTGGKHVLKRIMDITLAAAALLVLLPVFAALALMVRADSDGPAIFSQERVGKDGHPFRIYKFRSMTNDAPERLAGLRALNEGNGILFKLKDDPRVTRLGRILRKYSLDELPQIWNVLIGDMSLVGPRPPLPDEVDRYEAHVRRRLFIKPGLTGMWQIGGRSALSWEKSVQLDLYYVENWSVIGDLIIIWRTLQVLVTPLGAY